MEHLKRSSELKWHFATFKTNNHVETMPADGLLLRSFADGGGAELPPSSAACWPRLLPQPAAVVADKRCSIAAASRPL